MNETGSQSPPTRVSIIVPIYKNLQVTRNCIEALAGQSRPANAAVTLIIDGSPEPELVEYSRQAAQEHGFDILVNPENRGFVHTANIGMQLHTDADVILLNSDTTVSGNWVERLQRCAYASEKAGTVTPFSNNGTICSYPVFPVANDLPKGWDAPALDAVFSEANRHRQHRLPTAVGFCMYIKRQCLAETGLFDEDNFGLGYGEECDFCLRAAKLGWEHLLAADVFVYHEGGASFSTQSNPRKNKADEIMARLHPEYDTLVTAFIHRDPLQAFRQRVDEKRIEKRPTELKTVLQEHADQTQVLRAELTQERKNTDAVKQEQTKLEALLKESRREFQAADQSLKKTQATLDEAHNALETMGSNFTRVQAEAQALHAEVQRLASQIDALGAQLHACTDENNALQAERERIFASRSWRYTRWLRKEG